MQVTKLSDEIAVAGQIAPEHLSALADAGFRSVICNRPDEEEPGQPSFATIAAAAEAAGLEARHIPVDADHPVEMQQGEFARAMAELPGPVLAYCRTGNRSGNIYAAAKAAGNAQG